MMLNYHETNIMVRKIARKRCKMSSNRSLTIMMFYIFVICCLTIGDCDTTTVTHRLSGPDWNRIPTPPHFIDRQIMQTIYFAMENTPNNNGQNLDMLREHIMECRARGNPAPKYEWKKDGQTFDLDHHGDRITRLPGYGSFVFGSLTVADQGTYWCEATNNNGTAISTVTRLERTWIGHFRKSEPEIVKVELGDPYSRNCTPPRSKPSARVYWIFKGDEEGSFDSINSSHISTNDHGTIFFHYVKESDFKPNQYYTCTAENTKLQDYKFGNQFRLDVSTNKRRSLGTPVPPTEQYVNQSSPIALKGFEHKLHCFFSGFPEPVPSWYKDGRLIDEYKTGGFTFESHGKTLMFNVTMDKGGDYECRFDKHLGLDRNFRVVVQAAPYWLDGPPSNVNTSEGETVHFKCNPAGIPLPKVTFYKNGVEITTLANDDRWIVDQNSLTLYDVRKGQHGTGDNAVYQCKAENRHGYLWTNFYLNLLAFSPQLVAEPGQIETVLYKDVVLECQFFGSPLPNITWQGTSLQGSVHRVERTDPYGIGRLILKDVDRSASGDYFCKAQNKYGEEIGTGRLIIRKATRLVGFAPQQMTRIAGEHLELPCRADYDPEFSPQYRWLVNNLPIDDELMIEGHYSISNEHSLIIADPSKYDTAEYTCIVETRLDNSSRMVRLSIEDVPSPPHSAFVDPCEQLGQSAVVNFDHLESTSEAIEPVREFWVQYQIDPDDGVWRTHPTPVKVDDGQKLDGDVSSFHGALTVALQPFGKYKFRVVARNDVGDSAPLEVRGGCTTLAKIPDRNPDGVAGQGSTPDNLIVTWKSMSREDWNGPGFHYVVKYRHPEDVNWTEIPVFDPRADELAIELDEHTNTYEPFEIQVQAENDQGPASVQPATVLGHSGEGVPSIKPTGLTLLSKTGTTARLSWDAIDPQRMPGRFIGFKLVHWYEEDEAEKSPRTRKRRHVVAGQRQQVIFSPDATQGTVYNLKPDRVNFALLKVLNGQNEGPPSDVISFIMPEGVPTPVRHLSAFPLNAKPTDVEGAVMGITWKLPEHLNGQLDKYLLRYCTVVDGRMEESDCPEVSLSVSDKSTTMYRRLVGLNYRQPYRFVVKAITGGGEGDSNSVDSITLPHDAPQRTTPSVPVLLESGIGSNHINVTWIPGPFDESDPRPVGDGHYVKYRPADSSDPDEWQSVQPVAGNFTVTLADLQPGTRYSVVAVSVVGQGEMARETESPAQVIATEGEARHRAYVWWFILLLLLLLLIIIIFCLMCLLIRHRGARYDVSKKEQEQGREPMLGSEERGFGEYTKPDDEEKRSLTSKPESETDSMAEYGDNGTGRFTEDGQYGQKQTSLVRTSPLPGDCKGKSNVSTFV